MANEIQKAQFALMAALNPEQFIEMAVQQGFTPEQMSKGIPDFTPKMGKAKETAAPKGVATQPGAGAMPGPGAAGIDLNSLLRSGAGMGPPTVAQRPMGAPPTGTLPPLQGQAGPMAGTTAAGGQPSPSILDILKSTGLGIPPGAPLVQMPSQIPDPMASAAGTLGGLASSMMPPPTSPVPQGGPLGVTPPMVPPVGAGNPAAMAGTTAAGGQPSPDIMAILAHTLGIGGGTPLPAPAEGIMTDPSVAAMTPDPSGIAVPGLPPGGADPMVAAASLAGTIFPPAPGGFSPLFGGGTMAATPPAGGMPVMAGMPPSPTVIPPPPPPSSLQVPPPTPVSAGLKPVSSAKATTATPTKTPPPTGTPKQKAAAELAQVGARMTSGGGGRSGGPGGAGVHMGQIQQGELLDMILKSLAPASYSPGFIPYGKLF